ncbi:MAG: ATP-binding cassette domain-containing protein [Fibromonadales bacterium]|nr:ATP-binding cassette domain-containing protein [Fibromonadales bacterium]
MGLIYITGPSGSGKTRMILEMLGHIESQDSEMKLIYDGDKNDIAWMPQNPIWFKGTLWENLCPVEMRDLEEVKSALKRVNLGHFEQRLGESPNNFSGGEKRRLAIARIILLNRPLWILDEPFAGLDKANIEVIENLLKEESEAREIFCITHHVGDSTSGGIRLDFKKLDDV